MCTYIFKNMWKFLVTLLAPLVLSVIFTWNGGTTGKEPYAAFVISLMGIYWMTECVPIPVTSFIPIVLFPVFQILPTELVTSVYLNDSLLFLLGGCIIALSFEYSNLHSRIALKVMMLVGAKPSQLLFGIMATTMTLSMWMNNTSTTAMMVPIVNAIVEELKTNLITDSRRNSAVPRDSLEMSSVPRNNLSEIEIVPDPVPSTSLEMTKPETLLVRRMRIMFLLGTAFASNIGGVGVITGSATNLIVLDLVRKESDEPQTTNECRDLLEISFLDWMIFNVPPMLLNTILTWAYLTCHFLGCRSLVCWSKDPKEGERTKMENRIRDAIRRKFEALGSITDHEIFVLVFFTLMVFLWVFKNPEFMPGWDSVFEKHPNGKSIIKEATPTLLITVLLFVCPAKIIYFKNFRKGGLTDGLKDPLLKWSFVQKHFPWGIFILLGGGASMALGAKESGLNHWLGTVLASSDTLQSLPSLGLLSLVLALIAVMTTIASNTAVAAIITPILLKMAYVKGVHPLFLVLPAATVCSYAFILPVSTPPNAIVYNSSDQMKLGDMIVPGFVINIVSICVLLLTTVTTSEWAFGFSQYSNECLNTTRVI